MVQSVRFEVDVKKELTMKTLTIGKVASQAILVVETVRFYEREGVIAYQPRNSSSGYRR